MKYLKLFESFEDIDSICEKYRIKDYTINEDGSIDVNGDVYLSSPSWGKGLTELPLKFRNVSGNFHCYNNKLSTLEGSPKTVGGEFHCSSNKITSLKGYPESTGCDDFLFHDNLITSLEYLPTNIVGNIDLSNNLLTSLEGCPISVSGNFDCHNNKLTTLKGSPKFIRGSFYCSNYDLTSLEGCPECVDKVFDCGNEHAQNTGRNGRPLTTGYDTRKQIRTFEGLKLVGQFECSTTPVCLLWELFKDETKIELFNDFGITDGDVVITERLNEFLEMIGKSKINPSKIRDKRGYRFV